MDFADVAFAFFGGSFFFGLSFLGDLTSSLTFSTRFGGDDFSFFTAVDEKSAFMPLEAFEVDADSFGGSFFTSGAGGGSEKTLHFLAALSRGKLTLQMNGN